MRNGRRRQTDLQKSSGKLPVRSPRDPPKTLNSFVGRQQEMAAVTEVLATARLVTLTGPAGVGKSRLALEVVAGLRGTYPDGVSFVELAATTYPALVWRTVASALAVREQPGLTLADALTAWLGIKRTLVVLDNCEHVIAASAALAEFLLRNCPYLSILATSREALAVPGEMTLRVPSLSFPDTDDEVDASALSKYEAVRLFVERARAALPSFVLTDEVARDVGEICRRLDGIPLAIELAAARVEAFSPAQIADRLDDRFRFLTGGRRTALPRQQTLEAAIKWGHDLLSSREQALLRRLSVFSGSCVLAAVEEVCSGGEVERDQVFELLARLVAKSLVVADTTGAQARYRLLETIGEYARERLFESGEAESCRHRHAQWFVALVEAAEPHLTGADQQGWLDRIEAEHDNLRAALEWSLTREGSELALRLTAALVLYWRFRGCFSEGRQWLDAALSCGDHPPARPKGRATWGMALMAHMLGENTEAVRMAEESLALAEASDDDSGCARSLLVLGNCWRYLQDPGQAISLLKRSADAAREAGDPWCLAASLAMWGWTHVGESDSLAACPRFEECVTVARKSGDDLTLAMGLDGLGYVAFSRGDYPLAEVLLRESLAIARELGDTYGMVASLTSLGALATGRGHYERAREILDESFAYARELRSPITVAGPLARLGQLALDRGEPAMARPLFEELASIAEEAGGTSPVALQGLGVAAQALGNPETADRLLNEALAAARAAGNKPAIARALYLLGNLARSGDELARAALLHDEALNLESEVGNRRGVVDGLDAFAGLAAAQGRDERAARLFGAAQAQREANGYVRSAPEQARYDADVALVRQRLGAKEFEAAWAEGAALSLDEAVSYACRGRGPHRSRLGGWESLTRVEREVARLVAEGLTNPEIGDRLFIARGTVKAHLSRIFTKLGVDSRLELALRLRETHPEQ